MNVTFMLNGRHLRSNAYRTFRTLRSQSMAIKNSRRYCYRERENSMRTDVCTNAESSQRVAQVKIWKFRIECCMEVWKFRWFSGQKPLSPKKSTASRDSEHEIRIQFYQMPRYSSSLQLRFGADYAGDFADLCGRSFFWSSHSFCQNSSAAIRLCSVHRLTPSFSSSSNCAGMAYIN